MTEHWDGFKGRLEVGDMVRIVSSLMLDEIDVITTVSGMVHGGEGIHRVTRQTMKFKETLYNTEDTDKVLFERKALYKLPPDFFTVTSLEAAQRIKKLLLTHDET